MIYSQIEKLENQLEKEKKLNKYKQEILEQKLKSDLEIYRYFFIYIYIIYI